MSREAKQAAMLKAVKGGLLRAAHKGAWCRSAEIVEPGTMSKSRVSEFLREARRAGLVEFYGGASRRARYRIYVGAIVSEAEAERWALKCLWPRAETGFQADSAEPAREEPPAIEEVEARDEGGAVARGIGRIVDALVALADRVEASEARMRGVEERLESMFGQLVDAYSAAHEKTRQDIAEAAATILAASGGSR